MDKQRYCRGLLEFKDSGYTLFTYYKKQGIHHIPGLAIFVAALLLLFNANHELNSYSALVVGLYVGTMSRDIRWVMANKKVWPVKAFITDWSKLEEIANGES